MMEKVLLTDICRPKQWKTISTSQLKEKGYPVFGANGIIGFYDKFTHEKPTLLITCRGATCGALNISLPESYVNGNAMALDNLSIDFDLKYLYYYLSQRGFSDVISGSAQPQITRENLSKVKVTKPPLSEQKEISKKLDKAQEIIRYNEEIIAKYDALTQSLFLDMFGDPVKNEKGWEKKELKDISQISSGSTPSRNNEDFYIGEIPWVKTGEVKGKVILDTEEKISEEALKSSSCKLYPKGSLIIAMYGQGKTRGQVGILGIDATTNQACAVVLPSIKMNFEFLFQLLKLSYEDLRSLGRGGNQPNLNAGLIKNYKVINSPISLQNQFAERIQKIEVQKQAAQEELTKSEELFQSLLQQSF